MRHRIYAIITPAAVFAAGASAASAESELLGALWVIAGAFVGIQLTLDLLERRD